MSQRFFASTPIASDHVTLEGAEAHHLIHVMRARQGEAVVLLDGSGAEFDAELTSIGRSSAELHVLMRREVDRELPFPLILGVALPKGDRQRWLVEKAVEVGVTRLAPLTTERGVVQPREKTLDRLRRAVIEATKQCGRTRLMEIGAATSAGEFFAAAPHSARRLLAHPGGPSWPATADGDRATYLAVGPEGGFTDEEVAQATEAGWQRIDLGPRTLRVETAALALAAHISLGSR